jgi:hypothetical protein
VFPVVDRVKARLHSRTRLDSSTCLLFIHCARNGRASVQWRRRVPCDYQSSDAKSASDRGSLQLSRRVVAGPCERIGSGTRNGRNGRGRRSRARCACCRAGRSLCISARVAAVTAFITSTMRMTMPRRFGQRFLIRKRGLWLAPMDLSQQEERPPFDLIVDTTEILAQDAHANELRTAEKQNADDRARIAVDDRNAEQTAAG